MISKHLILLLLTVILLPPTSAAQFVGASEATIVRREVSPVTEAPAVSIEDVVFLTSTPGRLFGYSSSFRAHTYALTIVGRAEKPLFEDTAAGEIRADEQLMRFGRSKRLHVRSESASTHVTTTLAQFALTAAQFHRLIYADTVQIRLDTTVLTLNREKRLPLLEMYDAVEDD